MRRTLVLWAVTLVVTGCYDSYYDVGIGTKDTVVAIEIITEPAGADVEVNGNYIGQSPCTVTVVRRPDGMFRHDCEIRALPRMAGQSVQSKRFLGWPYNQPVPQRVFFNMDIGPRTPEIDINIR